MIESGDATGFSSSGDSPAREPDLGTLPGAEPAVEGKPAERAFAMDGRSWIARFAGEGLGGTGRLGIARFCLVHFIAAGEVYPRFEALIPSGTFPHLFDSELAHLLSNARPLPPPERR